jgi:hypothetical protein
MMIRKNWINKQIFIDFIMAKMKNYEKKKKEKHKQNKTKKYHYYKNIEDVVKTQIM